MTKSLLTREDIRRFIYQVVEEVKPTTPALYCLYKLSNKVGISKKLIKTYLRRGLPFIQVKKRKYYNLQDVVKWLDDNNIEFIMNEQF